MKGPSIGASVPRRGNAFMAGFGRLVLALLGWKIEGSIPDVPRLVAIVAPHTSNWDFVVGLAAVLALRLDARWLGKHTIFRPPFRGLLAWLGGIPIDRAAATDVVDQAGAAFRASDRLLLALAPEGTRRKVAKWKSGFHRIARVAGVPILLASFDYRTRVIELGPVFTPTDDFEADLAAILPRFTSAMARHPDMF